MRLRPARRELVRHHHEVGRPMPTSWGGIAEFERSLIRKRCEEGIQRAKPKWNDVRPAHCTRSPATQARR